MAEQGEIQKSEKIVPGRFDTLEDRAIFDNAAVGIAFTSARRFKRCNARWCEMFGYADGELIGQPAQVLYESESCYERLGEAARPVLAEGRAFETDIEFRRKDGSKFWCHLYGRAVSPAHPGHGTVWIAEDITAQRLARQSEHRIRQELEAVFTTAVVGIAVVRDRHLVSCNPRFEEIFGYPPGGLVGTSTRLWYVTEEEYAGPGASAYLDVARGEIHRREQQFRRQDGGVFWGRLSGRAFDPEKVQDGSVWILEDITERRNQDERLRQAQAELEAVFESAGVGIAVVRERVVIRCNRRCEELFGYASDEMVGQPTRQWYLSECDYDAIGSTVYDDLRRGALNRREQSLVRKDGSVFWGRLTGRAFDPANPNAGSVWVIEDTTERKKQEDWLREALDEQEMIFQNAAVGIMHVRKGIIHRCNRRLEELFGYGDGGLSGHSLRILQDDPKAFEVLRREAEPVLDRGRVYTCECALRRKDGSTFWVRATGHRTRGEDHGFGTIWMIEDVSERHVMQEALLRAHSELEQRVEARTSELVNTNAMLQAEVLQRMQSEERFWHIAHHDVLTGLPNRSLLHDRLNQALAQAERNGHRVGMLFVDLDRFKQINDTLGHEVGDVFLRAIAERIRGAVRAVDTVSRIGGDEFVVLLQDIAHTDDAILVASKILESLKPAVEVDGNALRPSASIGISFYPDDATDAAQLMRNADAAMYHAKSMGRNSFQFYAERMNEEASRLVLLEHDLRQVLENEEFEVHYQPLVDVSAGEVCGVEALIRWRHPHGDLVLPAEFLPLAEETGLILPIGDWVLRTACRQAAAWQAAGYPAVPVAVNLSPRQFARRDLVDGIRAILAETGLAGKRLELEITETSLMRDFDETRAKLDALAELGVRLTIDDFGTGFCNIGQLKHLPIQRLKIDQSFVADAVTDRDSAAVVAAIIGLARNLGLSLVAEGVEEAEQLRALTDSGCVLCQGFCLSRPLPAELAAEIFRPAGLALVH